MERGQEKMFRNSIGAVSTLLFCMLVFGASTGTAGELQEVINKRNSDTDGPYFNLSSQEKASLIFFGGEISPDEPLMFTDECSDLTIHYVTHKKSTVTDLTVMKSCNWCFKVLSDERLSKVTLSCEKEDVHVFAEVRSKPDKKENSQDPRSIRWDQYSVFDACNDTDHPVPDSPVYPDFPVYLESPDASLLTLGPIDVRDIYDSTPEEFIRYETETSKGKEKVKPPNITRLFKWVGWLCQANIFDINSDGNADAYGFTFVKTY
jgi:hypothetical protein